ncbi:MAG: tetratricopeptide repeat protein [Vicinamibacterales bacterium]
MATFTGASMARCVLVTGAVFVITASMVSTAAAQSRREMQMMADLRMLQEQNQQMQNALVQLGEALKAINGRLDEQGNVTRKAFADQKLIVDQFASDLRIVRERVDETNVRLTSLSQELEALRLAIPQYPPPTAMSTDPSADPNASIAPPGAVTGDPAPSSGLPAPQPAGSSSTGMSPQRLFDTARSDHGLGQWALCVQGFDTYLRTFPRNDAADDAQFYIGECQYSDGKFTEAIDAYNRVVANYPRGDRVPDAYYKRGLAFERLNQPDRARESHEGAVKNFPDSDAARLSKQRLDALSRAKPPG